MSKRPPSLLRDERGGAHVLLFALLSVLCAVLLLATSVDWMLQSANKTKSKLALDRATHAAALHVDMQEAAFGRLVWDESAGRAEFARFLRLNFGLDEAGEPAEGGRLEAAPVVHRLEFVTAPAYPATVRRTVVAREGTSQETTRRVDVTVYGPSVVAVVEVHQRVRGVLEPIVLSSVASVRFR
ncbi:hypothetical protein FE782_11315 [Paenibacillus antri]|uniref:Uncharacterized protein n=1 Tax=Paenibacillus antri TaxID=2582848 RepID=A0A5R9GFD8_9BACL|nr:hypothetical protein [Paenibacillus antri]TLS51964.1 hypothetical protein FE782_11315 [Paenibacillus antri]